MDEVVSDAKLSETCFQKLGDKLDMALRLLYGGRGGGHGTLQTACQVCHENDDNQQKETQEVCVCVRTRSSFFFCVCVTGPTVAAWDNRRRRHKERTPSHEGLDVGTAG